VRTWRRKGTLDQIAALKWMPPALSPMTVTLLGSPPNAATFFWMLSTWIETTRPSACQAQTAAISAPPLSPTRRLSVSISPGERVLPTTIPQALVKLRAMSPEEITDGLNLANSSGGNPPTFNPGGPIVDGTIVTQIGQAYASGAFRRVPMMIGATSGDMGGRTGFMVGGARQISGVLADKGIPTYYYRFSYVPESLDREAAAHASDIPFFMNTQRVKYGDKTSARDDAAGKVISSYVVKFVKADPKNPQIEGWSRYQRQGGKMMDFSRQGSADLIDDPWGAEIDAAPPSRYPGMRVGGAAGRGAGRGER
jgi:para-nitrobenzyl esterase